jgi:predicted metal-dependent phosphoesterase TrpH
MEFRADLHCHSSCSDGSHTPMEILLLAKKNGLKGISITDHDTLSAYTDEFFSLAKELDIEVLVGIEMSSDFQGLNVHILGYNVPLNSGLNSFIESIQEKRESRNKAIIRRLQGKNISITWEEMKDFSQRKGIKPIVIGRPHIALLLKQKGYVSTTQEAFDKYINDNGSCYVSGGKYSSEEVIKRLHEVKAKAVLAHPHLIKKRPKINKIINLPFDGVEGYYSLLYPSIEQKWIEIAKKKKWLVTGGSDFHGDIKRNIPLGCSWVGRTVFDQLKEQ